MKLHLQNLKQRITEGVAMTIEIVAVTLSALVIHALAWLVLEGGRKLLHAAGHVLAQILWDVTFHE